MEVTKILCWNCRGLMKPEKISRIKTLMREHQPDFVCLVETRADANRAIKFCDKFAKVWEWAAIPAQGMSGGIITLWKWGVGMVTPIAKSRFALYLILTTDKPKHWVLSVIYNAQSILLHKKVWRDLAPMTQLNLPWILVGDFNAILTNEEHKGSEFDNYSAKAKAFSEFVSSSQLMDLGYQGSPFTWTNNQQGLARRWARLDRFLANNDWIGNFETYLVKHLHRTASDYSPIFLSTKLFDRHKKKVFRFENYWLEHENCYSNVNKAWTLRTNTTPMHAFNHLLSRTRNYLSNWRKTGLSPLDKDITKTEE
ncbi:hypothetical protein J5N97_008131 [Dioscorea zingiberensis]|uniref:Endonuclease/exonuclease/phosphatase domain-containing protein n=1 Tax=Dioscorea zingiberensis TaxID=325984 RepID=A0A9D5HUA9_9LILI|nr:hypothetical protein J5N97_008131 [Dioscorea zingiberensis]